MADDELDPKTRRAVRDRIDEIMRGTHLHRVFGEKWRDFLVEHVRLAEIRSKMEQRRRHPKSSKKKRSNRMDALGMAWIRLADERGAPDLDLYPLPTYDELSRVASKIRGKRVSARNKPRDDIREHAIKHRDRLVELLRKRDLASRK